MKRIWAMVLSMALLCGCSAAPAVKTTAQTVATTEATVPTVPTSDTVPAETKSVGICLPDKEVQRWTEEADVMAKALRELGYYAQVFYAADSAQEQARQIEKLVQGGVDCLVIAPVDSAALLETVSLAQSANIPIIAYDRLLMDSDAVSAFVGFDYYGIGTQLGTYIAEKKLQKVAADNAESVTIEFFMGSPEDNNALQMYLGLMEVLQYYLDNGTLVCATGRTAFEDCCVSDWSGDLARDYCARYLEENYMETVPDILCAASDALAEGCVAALDGLENAPAVWPLITGCGSGNLGGTLSVTVELDTMLLTEPTVQIVHALLSGEKPEFNDTERCHNNAATIPAYLHEITLITE